MTQGKDRASPILPLLPPRAGPGEFGTFPARERPSPPSTSWSENELTPNAKALHGVGKVVARPASLAPNEVLSPLPLNSRAPMMTEAIVALIWLLRQILGL